MPGSLQTETFDVVVIGAGIAGLTAAALLQHDGFRTLLLEAHDKPGGCAGYFQREGFTFDVGATVLMGLDPDGIHTFVYNRLGLQPPETTLIECVRAWLPDGVIDITRDQTRWGRARIENFARDPRDADRLAAFWALVDSSADTVWKLFSKRPLLPLRGIRDVAANLRLLSFDAVALTRYAFSTFEDVLRQFDLHDHFRLRKFLDGLLLITVQETAERAPFPNGAAGIDIYRHGIRRARGGMKSLVRSHIDAFRSLGGTVKWRQKVTGILPESAGGWRVETERGLSVRASRVVANVPVWNVSKLVKTTLDGKLSRSLEKAGTGWGAFTLYLGLDDSVVPPDTPLNHQVLQTFEGGLEEGNSCFLSLGERGDRLSAPEGKRVLTVSTHTAVENWRGGSPERYAELKSAMTERLLGAVRRVFPDVDRGIDVLLPGTPATFERYTGRERGMVGGVRARLSNSNLFAVPSDVGLPNFWLVGDTTFPGQGTPACALSGINAWRDIRRT